VDTSTPDETASAVGMPGSRADAGPPADPDPAAAATGAEALVVPEIVCLPAEIDITNAADCGDELRAAIKPDIAVVIADMTRTEFCDSQGMRQLVLAHDRAAEAGAELRLAIESPAVLRALRITGLDQLLRIYPSMQAALEKD
jgi:anti-sigma B factor antagonist